LSYKFEFKNIVETYGYRKSVHIINDREFVNILIAMSFEPLGDLTSFFYKKTEASPLAAVDWDGKISLMLCWMLRRH